MDQGEERKAKREIRLLKFEEAAAKEEKLRDENIETMRTI
jgi:hypothetical protein